MANRAHAAKRRHTRRALKAHALARSVVGWSLLQTAGRVSEVTPSARHSQGCLILVAVIARAQGLERRDDVEAAHRQAAEHFNRARLQRQSRGRAGAVGSMLDLERRRDRRHRRRA